jgi:hypothetical protein
MNTSKHILELIICMPFPLLFTCFMPSSSEALFGDYLQYYSMGLGLGGTAPFSSRPLVPVLVWLLGGGLWSWALVNGVLFFTFLFVYLETFGYRALLILLFASLVRMPFSNMLWPCADASVYLFIALALCAAKYDNRKIGFGLAALAGLAHPAAFLLCLAICFLRWLNAFPVWICLGIVWFLLIGHADSSSTILLAGNWKAAILALNVLLLGIVPVLRHLLRYRLDWWDCVVIAALVAVCGFAILATDTSRMIFYVAPFLAVNVAKMSD